MDPLQTVFTDNKCVNIRIDLTKDIPLTILGKYPALQKKDRRILLHEIIYAEDFPPLADVFNEIVSGRQKALNAHCRVMVGGSYHWMYLSCSLRKDTFNKTLHLTGTMMDVSEYLDASQDDMVLEEVKKNSDRRFQAITAEDSTLADILGRDYLCRIQQAFEMTEGIVSAIFDSEGAFICSSDPAETGLSLKKYRFTKTEQIRYNHRMLASWTIAGNDEAMLEKNAPLLNVLSQTVAQIANAILVLYNEMENSKKANQQLGSNIEQQILLNNIYTIILEKKDSDEALRTVIRLVGEYLKLDRIALYDYDAESGSTELSKEWAAHAENLHRETKFSCDRYPELMSELNYCDTYFSVPGFTELESLGVKSFVVSQLAENGKFTGLIFYETLYEQRIWSNGDKKLLRNISQIISTMLIRCNMDSALKAQNEQLKRLAYTDPVLDISNRTRLDKDLQAELEKEASGAAIALKVTNMRSVNEAFGHIHSDGLLKKIAKYIDGTEMKGKRVYRFSGSVLMIILKGSTAEKTKEFADSLISRFRRPWITDGEEHYMEIVAGIALYPENGVSCEELYRAATLSMYRAGEYGKNNYAFYSGEFERDAGVSFTIEQRLRRSIFNKMDGFSVEFQPVTTPGGDIASMEAVVRWTDGEIGSFPPKKLIKLAESIGIDNQIDTWVIDRACAFCREMIDYTGFEGFMVNVNLTARELYHSAAVETVKNALQRYGLSGENLIIEGPERAQIRAYNEISPALGQLRKMNVQIAIDDFGKEFMSLSALKNSYISIIKMNVALFSGVMDEFDRSALESVISLAHQRDIKVCVKHIEHPYQFDSLKEYDIDMLQGSCISPMAGAEASKALFAPAQADRSMAIN